MKKILSFFALAALLLTASCSKQESPVLGEDQVIISLGLEGVSTTRAISDGSLVDKLVYEVYDGNGALLGTMDKTETVTFPYSLSLPLAKGQDYTILFWAQDSDCQAYNTDNLKNVVVDYTTNATNNDETRDAFYAAVNVHVTGGPQKVEVVLNRPFAQVNVAVPQAEWQRAIDAGVNVSQSSVVFTQEVAKKIDLSTGNVSEYASVQYTAEAIPTEKLTVNNEDYVYLSMSYILVGKEKSMVNNATFTFNSNVNAVTLSVPNLPVQRNYRTNVLGTFLVDYVDFNIVVDPIYNTPDEVYPDEDVEYLYDAAANGGEVTLNKPVTLNEPLNVEANMILNMNGQTLTGSINLATGVSLTVTNGTIVNTDESTSGIVSNGDLTLNNVNITSARHALRIESGKAVIDGGEYKVEPLSSKTVHALNVGDDNTVADVLIKNGKFIGPKGTKGDSGSAVNVRTGSKVTIENGDFSGGKNKTLSNGGTLIVKGGAYDQDPSAYVDAAINKVVNQDSKYYVVKNDVDVIVGNDDSFSNELNNTTDTDVVIYLTNDVTVDVAAWMNDAFGGTSTNTITIEGNNHKISFNQTNSDWNNIVTNGAKLIIKNAHITNSGYNNGPWNRHDLNFACEVELVNVVSDKAIALKAGATLNKVTINDANDSDTYAIWIQPNGQTVDLDECTIDMLDCTDGRGIKIDEQYVDAPEKVTLKVSNTKFSTEEKSAILVKSKAGAEIVLSNVDITNVGADNEYPVWVDEASEAYYNLVVVSGGLKRLEGANAVSNNQGVADAIKAGKKVIYLEEGSYVIPGEAKGKTLTFIGVGNAANTNIETQVQGSEGCDYSLDGSTVRFENISINTTSRTYTGYARMNGTYVNCIINGTYTLYGDSSFEGCTFNVSGDVYNIWTWGAPKAVFNNCTFNSDGKAMLLYGQVNTQLTINNSIFNDNGGLTDLKAAIEIGNDYNTSYNLVVNNTKVYGYEINPNGISTGTTLWANKNSMPKDKLNVVVDGVDVY